MATLPPIITNYIGTNLVIPGIGTALSGAISATQSLGSSGSTITTPSGTQISIPNSSTSNPQSTTYIAAAQAFAMNASRLKPSTVHTFTFNGVNASSQCQPTGGILGAPIITDSNGNTSFTFYYNSGLSSTASSLSAAQDLINRMAGTVVGTLANIDNTSIANVTISYYSANSTNYINLAQLGGAENGYIGIGLNL